MKAFYRLISLLLFLVTTSGEAQNVSLFDQINGQYDFLMLGNTMNLQENGANDPCLINTSSSAALSLGAGTTVARAFLYWAGSGPGDFNVKLNGVDILAERTFPFIFTGTGLPFFGAFADVTQQVATAGNGTYTLSELDVSPWLNPAEYCVNGTNFAGWAIVVVYQDPGLPLNQINVYDGLQAVPTSLNITLDSLNVIDDVGAQIGFVAWEGDRQIANGEILTINGSPIGNPPLNPVSNAFNGTNSYTGSTTLYNMDLDVYDIQNNIAPGDNTAEIALSSSQDFVMINCIITKLNSQLPDATASINNIGRTCNSRDMEVFYTISNLNSTDVLPAATPVTIYVNGTAVATTLTAADIPVGGSVDGSIFITIPSSVDGVLNIDVVADDSGNGMGVVTELIENNNRASVQTSLLTSPEFNAAEGLVSCNLGLTRGIFDFSGYDELIRTDAAHTVTFHETEADALAGSSPIGNTASYEAMATPKMIWVRVNNGDCISVTSFPLSVRNCPPTIYNYVSANNDGTNDDFFIGGLRDIFVNFKIEIYNRWGVKIWEGNNNTDNWNGTATRGLRIGGNEVPDGTYYYVLYLNDPDYREPMAGFLYLNR